MGFVITWSTCIVYIMGVSGYSDEDGDQVGLCNALAEALGALFFGYINDKLGISQQKYRLKLFIISIFTMVSLIAFSVALPLWPDQDVIYKGATVNYLSGTAFMIGLFSYMKIPMMYEFCAELAYPASEAVSGLIITLACSVSGVAYFLSDPEHR